MKVFAGFKRRFFLFLILSFAFNFLNLNATEVGRRKRRRNLDSTQNIGNENFSKTVSRYISDDEIDSNQEFFIWECEPNFPFTELILSWNAIRPESGKMTFWVNIKHSSWAGWQRLAEWGAKSQRTFVNKLNRFVHTTHSKVELKKGQMGTAFKVKVVFQKGANPKNLKALFACLSNVKKFKGGAYVSNLPSVIVSGVPRQSQMVLNHPRYRDLCSPTSTGIIVNYFNKKLYGDCSHDLNSYMVDFAGKVYDNGYLNIYGNWPLNVAAAHDATYGNVFFRVERLNFFDDLYKYLSKKIPVAVSVRRLRGGATSYANGHLMVVVGWNREKQCVLCIDPAFSRNSSTPKAYRLRSFLGAWGRSLHLSYVPIPREQFAEMA
jgi:hypothetical protein